MITTKQKITTAQDILPLIERGERVPDQQIFDAVAHHLLTQGRGAADPESDRCYYRHPSGTKCAAGALIPDSFYEPWMDNGRNGGGGRTGVWFGALFKPGHEQTAPAALAVALGAECFLLTKEQEQHSKPTLISALQSVHDSAHQVVFDVGYAWRSVVLSKMRKVADEFRLSSDAMLEFAET